MKQCVSDTKHLVCAWHIINSLRKRRGPGKVLIQICILLEHRDSLVSSSPAIPSPSHISIGSPMFLVAKERRATGSREHATAGLEDDTHARESPTSVSRLSTSLLSLFSWRVGGGTASPYLQSGEEPMDSPGPPDTSDPVSSLVLSSTSPLDRGSCSGRGGPWGPVVGWPTGLKEVADWRSWLC